MTMAREKVLQINCHHGCPLNLPQKSPACKKWLAIRNPKIETDANVHFRSKQELSSFRIGRHQQINLDIKMNEEVDIAALARKSADLLYGTADVVSGSADLGAEYDFYIEYSIIIFHNLIINFGLQNSRRCSGVWFQPGSGHGGEYWRSRWSV